MDYQYSSNIQALLCDTEKTSSHHKTISILHLLSRFYIEVCNNDVGSQFTHMVVNPTGAQFKQKGRPLNIFRSSLSILISKFKYLHKFPNNLIHFAKSSFRFYFPASTIFFYDKTQMIFLIDVFRNCQHNLGKVTHDTRGLHYQCRKSSYRWLQYEMFIYITCTW